MAGALSVLVDGRPWTPATGAVCAPWTALGAAWAAPGCSTVGVTAPTAFGAVWNPWTAVPLGVKMTIPVVVVVVVVVVVPPVSVPPVVPPVTGAAGAHSTQKTLCLSSPGVPVCLKNSL